jgi:hypothetical protein
MIVHELRRILKKFADNTEIKVNEQDILRIVKVFDKEKSEMHLNVISK